MSTSKPPLAHQLAKASWLAPILVVLMNSMLASALREHTSASGAVVSTLIGVFLLTVGLVAGVAAFPGIRKHGRKGILIPATIGTLVCAVLLVIVATNFSAALSKARSSSVSEMEETVRELNAGLPRMLDEETELTAVILESDRIIYSYRLVATQPGDLDVEVFESLVQPDLARDFCGTMTAFLARGNSVVARYHTADDGLMSELVLSNDDCGTSR